MLGDRQLQTNFQQPVTEFMRADFYAFNATITAYLIGLLSPNFLRMLKLDPKTAAVTTLVGYFGMATLVFNR